jgi:hypothetical protein
MLNIYVIVLTIIVLYVLNMFWKHLDFEKKVIEGFTGTTTNNDSTAIQNLASAYNSGTATLTNLTTTGNLNVSGASTLNDVTIASGKNLTIGGQNVITRINDISGSLNTRIIPIDTKITGIEGRLTTAEGKFAPIDTKITGIEGRLTTAEGKFAPIDTKITGIEGRLTTAEGKFAPIDTKITGIEGRLTTAEGKFSPIDTKITGIEGRLTTAEGKFAPIDTKIASIDAKIPIFNRADTANTISGTLNLKGATGAPALVIDPQNGAGNQSIKIIQRGGQEPIIDIEHNSNYWGSKPFINIVNKSIISAGANNKILAISNPTSEVFSVNNDGVLSANEILVRGISVNSYFTITTDGGNQDNVLAKVKSLGLLTNHPPGSFINIRWDKGNNNIEFGQVYKNTNELSNNQYNWLSLTNKGGWVTSG